MFPYWICEGSLFACSIDKPRKQFIDVFCRLGLTFQYSFTVLLQIFKGKIQVEKRKVEVYSQIRIRFFPGLMIYSLFKEMTRSVLNPILDIVMDLAQKRTCVTRFGPTCIKLFQLDCPTENISAKILESRKNYSIIRHRSLTFSTASA